MRCTVGYSLWDLRRNEGILELEVDLVEKKLAQLNKKLSGYNGEAETGYLLAKFHDQKKKKKTLPDVISVYKIMMP